MRPRSDEQEQRRDPGDETIVMRRPRTEDTVVMPLPPPEAPADAPAAAPPRADAGGEYRWWTPRPSHWAAKVPRPPRSWRPYALTAALFVAAAAVGLGGGALVATQLRGGDHGHPAHGARAEAATPKHPAGPTAVPVRQVGSFDPSGGSGFQRRGGGWATQHYTSPTFGNLKPGVGLVLDLGHPVRVGAVELLGVTPGTVLQLRAGDVAPHGASPLPAAGGSVQATGGRTVLYPHGAAAHRYWVVWVTRLGGSGGGYQAAIGDVRVVSAKG